jgi:hypothetical protein
MSFLTKAERVRFSLILDCTCSKGKNGDKISFHYLPYLFIVILKGSREFKAVSVGLKIKSEAGEKPRKRCIMLTGSNFNLELMVMYKLLAHEIFSG